MILLVLFNFAILSRFKYDAFNFYQKCFLKSFYHYFICWILCSGMLSLIIIQNAKYWCSKLQIFFILSIRLRVSVNLANFHSFKNIIIDWFIFSLLFRIFLRILNILTLIFSSLLSNINSSNLSRLSPVDLFECLSTSFSIVLFTTSSQWWLTFCFIKYSLSSLAIFHPILIFSLAVS